MSKATNPWPWPAAKTVRKRAERRIARRKKQGRSIPPWLKRQASC